MRFYYKPDIFVLSIILVGYLWGSAGSISSISFWIAMAVTLFMGWFIIKMPLYTYVDEDVIRVQQLVGSTTFRRSQVTLRRLNNHDLDGMIRNFGSGGVGGYIGFFQNARLGRFYMLAVSRSNLALITTVEGKQFVIHFPPQN
ncbi:MAG: hypothetical protein NTY32_05220 [Bacteroidia bacterium]|nr:hypothetical protein [Bacteroidia bacterium]